MFDLSNEKTTSPIKIWLPDVNSIEAGCLEQAYHLSSLPFLHKWVALMPDTHVGMGMPIGGVIATKDVVIPNAVGVDIGCGMAFTSTNIQINDMKNTMTDKGTLIEAMIQQILRDIPLGFHKHQQKQDCAVMDRAKEELDLYEDNIDLMKFIELSYYQVGTLGGGNHFIELQEDEEGNLGIMIHSGSRNFGKQVCDYFNHHAQELNRQWYSEVPNSYQLSFLPTHSETGQQYIRWMDLALGFAKENRQHMMQQVKMILEKWAKPYIDLPIQYNLDIDCHHNYASLEHHYGRQVYVHRKGATRARKGELAVIPGAMGSYSYVVEGLGNNESFHSCSHGAGRAYSRRGAMAEFTTQEVVEDLKSRGIVLGKQKLHDVAEESRFAYKNIDEVMANQKDLVTPIKRLHTVGVVKG